MKQRARLGLLAIVLGVLVLSGCSRSAEDELDFLVQTEGGVYDEIPVGDERIDELRQDVRELEDEVREQALRLGRIASYRKLMAQELMDMEMYGPALEQLQAAMELQTENATLFYLAGVAAGRSARARMDEAEMTGRLELAERMYREAVGIRPDYRDALYGLVVVLAFELDRADEALEFARRLAREETGDPSVSFLLANVLVRTGNTAEAQEIYGRLAREAPSAGQREQAARNQAALAGEGMP